MQTPAKPVKIWYSFAEVDAPLLAQVEAHLSLLCREGMMSTWRRRQIVAGRK